MRKMRFPNCWSRFKWSAIEVYDVAGVYIDNDWQDDWPGQSRTISAIPLLEGSQKLLLQPEGESSSTSLALITNSELYFTDINYQAQKVLQSYVLWKDYYWRVTGVNQMLGNTDTLQIYSAERYVR